MSTRLLSRYCLLPALAVASLTACGGVESSASGATINSLASGTRIEAAITEAISSRHGAVGDRFSATVVRDVRGVGGRVLIPAGSLVSGAITEVATAPNAESTGTLTLAVSELTISGTSYPLEASIDSLATVQEERNIDGADVARVVGGAVAGAVIGRVIGGNAKGTVIGGVMGAGAGVIVSAAVKDMDIVLPAGSHLMLTLRRQLAVTGGRE